MSNYEVGDLILRKTEYGVTIHLVEPSSSHKSFFDGRTLFNPTGTMPHMILVPKKRQYKHGPPIVKNASKELIDLLKLLQGD